MKRIIILTLCLFLLVGIQLADLRGIPATINQASADSTDIPDIPPCLQVPLVLGEINAKENYRGYSYDYLDGILGDDPVNSLINTITRDYAFELMDTTIEDYRKTSAALFKNYYFRYTGSKSTSSLRDDPVLSDYDKPYQVRISVHYHYSENRTGIHVRYVSELRYAGDYGKQGQSFNGGASRSGSGGGTDWDSMPSVQKPEVRCSRCNGKGEITCSRCDGKKGKYEYGQTGNYGGSTSPNNGSKRWVNCDKCHGSGMMTCPYCNGSGKG